MVIHIFTFGANKSRKLVLAETTKWQMSESKWNLIQDHFNLGLPELVSVYLHVAEPEFMTLKL